MYLLMNCLKICDKETATSSQSFFKKRWDRKRLKTGTGFHRSFAEFIKVCCKGKWNRCTSSTLGLTDMLNMVRSRKKQSIGFTAKVRRSKNADRVSRNLTRLKKKIAQNFQCWEIFDWQNFEFQHKLKQRISKPKIYRFFCRSHCVFLS